MQSYPKDETHVFLKAGVCDWESRLASVHRRAEHLIIQRMCSLIQIINRPCPPTPDEKKKLFCFSHTTLLPQKTKIKRKLSFPSGYTEKNVYKVWNETLFQLWQPLSPTPVKWVSTPSLDPTPPLTGTYRCMWTSLLVLVLCVTQIHIRIHSVAFAPLNCPCSQRRQALRISSGSVFHLIGSRVYLLTARRWRPRRPCGRHLYSLAGRAARCKRGGGDIWDTCLSVYCNLPGLVLWVCFVWTSPLQSAGWWIGRWGYCSGRGPVLLNGACGGSPGAEWSRWCPGLLVANTAWSATDCDCHNLEGWLDPWSESLWPRLHIAGPENGGEGNQRSRELK